MKNMFMIELGLNEKQDIKKMMSNNFRVHRSIIVIFLT